jgi:hypothetical protein
LDLDLSGAEGPFVPGSFLAAAVSVWEERRDEKK